MTSNTELIDAVRVPAVTGIDLSLSSTGMATVGPAGELWVDTITTRKTGHERLAYLRHAIYSHVKAADLTVIEGPGQVRVGRSGEHELAGLWWLIVHQVLWVNDIPAAIVAPESLRRYATGKPNAKTNAVLTEVSRRWPAFVTGAGEAGALALLAMGLDHLGQALTPMPPTHRAALDTVDWPKVVTDTNTAE